MRGFGSFAAAARFCAGFEGQRQDFRAVSRSGERWATAMAELASA